MDLGFLVSSGFGGVLVFFGVLSSLGARIEGLGFQGLGSQGFRVLGF